MHYLEEKLYRIKTYLSTRIRRISASQFCATAKRYILIIIAISPQLMVGDGWSSHAGEFFEKMRALDGVRMPGARRHQNRQDTGTRQVNSALIETIESLNA